jgi:hypothetical protein
MWGGEMAVQLKIKVIFWQHGITGQLVMGAPEGYPAPPFYNKIVCNTAHEAEHYSRLMRDQEASRESMIDEEREGIEGEMIRNLRSHMHHQMAHARNAMNRDFLRIWLERQERMVNKTRSERVSYLHAEGFESGH